MVAIANCVISMESEKTEKHTHTPKTGLVEYQTIETIW